MRLQQLFLIYTLIIVLISVFIGFIISNVIYVAFVNEKMNNRYLQMAEQLAEEIEQQEINFEGALGFLETMSHLGYQIALVSEDGEMITFGEPFKKTALSDEMLALFEGEKVYHGVKNMKKSYLMLSHFSNDVRNTTGTTITLEEQEWALFLRSNNTSFFTEFHLIILGFIIAVFISSIVGILFMSRRLSNPLTELTSATNEIANHNYEYPLMVNRKDEIGQLADSFRMMQKRLANTDEARKKFINNVSHDFQSPLLNIQGYAELLDKEVTSVEGKKYIQVIQSEARRLSNLTKQLLILTTIDQGTYILNKQFVRIDEQLRQVINSMLWRIEEKGLEIKIDLQPITLYADRSLLMNVWENLISNAIKYNKEYGEIALYCYEDEHHVIVKIQDTGIGIQQNVLEKIFERFYRLDKARNKDGMGLGLSIVQEVLAYHEATIEVDSEINKGTTFIVSFPKSE